jgi:hypothetical protein
LAKLARLFVLIAKGAKKLDDTVPEADIRLLTGNKYHKFFEILAILFVQDLV